MFKSIKKLANLELARVSKWMLINNLIVNASKTIALTISLKTRNLPSALAVYYNTLIIHPSESTKYLGINLDDQLSLKSHIKFLESKIAPSVSVIARLSFSHIMT